MKTSLKRYLKYAILDLGWFAITISNATWLYCKFPALSWEGASILFLGVSAYILGGELIGQRKNKVG